DGLFAGAAGSHMFALAAVLVLFQTTNECFVDFHSLAVAAKGLGRVQLAHCFAKAMLHEPCSLVGHLEPAVHLIAGNALLSRRHQMGGLEPLMQRDMSA